MIKYAIHILIYSALLLCIPGLLQAQTTSTETISANQGESIPSPVHVPTIKHSLERDFKWILGYWNYYTINESIWESWKLSGNIITGEDRDSKKQLVMDGNRPVYIVTVKGTVNGKSIRYPLKSLADSTAVFENTGHNFPQRITYIRKQADTLIVAMEGSGKNGEPISEIYRMSQRKFKCGIKNLKPRKAK